MGTSKLTTTWHHRNPKLVEEIRRDLAAEYPTLHLIIEGARAQVRGTFPVLSPERQVLDRFAVVINLPSDYPKSLPVVREVGGRIPWKRDKYHIEESGPSAGTACVLLPDARWESFPVGAPFLQYLKGPLHNFFLGQALVAVGEDWPHGEWSHGPEGIYEYYQRLLNINDRTIVHRFIYVLSKPETKRHWECPCGSGKKIKNCCARQISEIRRKIPATIAKHTLKTLGVTSRLYQGPRIRD